MPRLMLSTEVKSSCLVSKVLCVKFWDGVNTFAASIGVRCRAMLSEIRWVVQTTNRCLRSLGRPDGDGLCARLDASATRHRLCTSHPAIDGARALQPALGVHPLAFHHWHMAMYADAIDWVSLPNALGMSQFGDGGLMATKPYCASGNYIDGMSNYCKGCRYKPRQATGDDACPFTTLYWDFLARHQVQLRSNPRMTMQLKNLARKDAVELSDIRQGAERMRRGEIRPSESGLLEYLCKKTVQFGGCPKKLA